MAKNEVLCIGGRTLESSRRPSPRSTDTVPGLTTPHVRGVGHHLFMGVRVTGAHPTETVHRMCRRVQGSSFLEVHGCRYCRVLVKEVDEEKGQSERVRGLPRRTPVSPRRGPVYVRFRVVFREVYSTFRQMTCVVLTLSSLFIWKLVRVVRKGLFLGSQL